MPTLLKACLAGAGCWLALFLLTPYLGSFSILLPLVWLFSERINSRAMWPLSALIITFALVDFTTASAVPLYLLTTILALIFYVFVLESAITSGHVWGKLASILLWFVLWQVIFWLLNQLYQEKFLTLGYLFDLRWLVGIFGLWILILATKKLTKFFKSLGKNRPTNLSYV